MGEKHRPKKVLTAYNRGRRVAGMKTPITNCGLTAEKAGKLSVRAADYQTGAGQIPASWGPPNSAPVEFTGWDAYRYRDLAGTFEVKGSDCGWVELGAAPEKFHADLTYRFTAEAPKLNRAYTDDEAYSKACCDLGPDKYFTAEGSWHAALKWLRSECSQLLAPESAVGTAYWQQHRKLRELLKAEDGK